MRCGRIGRRSSTLRQTLGSVSPKISVPVMTRRLRRSTDGVGGAGIDRTVDDDSISAVARARHVMRPRVRAAGRYRNDGARTPRTRDPHARITRPKWRGRCGLRPVAAVAA